ncbi:MAG: metal ABC transporter ATP-binding protein [Planctomycetes bacterium]|nr:metal ABC transporter ATP-binding protein [Planctomycetota bacterium]
MQAAPAVAFSGVTVRAGGVSILESVTAGVPAGSFTAIVGPNGAGKTTLLLAMLGQIAHGGRIEKPPLPDGTAPRIGYVPQKLEFDRGMPLSVMEMMTMGIQRLPVWLWTGREKKRVALELLAAVKAEHLAKRPLGALSGGELQRVLLALAVQRRPHILALDEPVAGVDISGESLLCELLEDLRAKYGLTVIMVTHDLSIVTAHADHVICLNRRVMGEGPVPQTLRPEILSATFGLHLGLAHLHLDGSRHLDCPICRDLENHES